MTHAVTYPPLPPTEPPDAGMSRGQRSPARERLVEGWAEAAISHATVRTINDPAGLVATVAGIDGAWGFGQSEDEALDDLKSVLVDWASLKLQDGDDIPSEARDGNRLGGLLTQAIEEAGGYAALAAVVAAEDSDLA